MDKSVRDKVIDMLVQIDYNSISDDSDLIKDLLMNGCSGYRDRSDEELLADAQSYVYDDEPTEMVALLKEYESQIQMNKAINDECPF